MRKLSKTAAAAQKAVELGQQKTKVELSPEQKLKNIRTNLESGFWVQPEQQRFLLAQYDEAVKQLELSEEKRKGQLDIIKRSLEHDEDAFLANDYGGLGWEQGEPMETIRRYVSALQKLEEAAVAAGQPAPLQGLIQP